jgi:hypothetical protein
MRRPSQVLIVTERKFGRRALNRIFSRTDPTSPRERNRHWNSALQTTSLSVRFHQPNPCHRIGGLGHPENYRFYEGKHWIGPETNCNVSGIKDISRIRVIFTHFGSRNRCRKSEETWVVFLAGRKKSTEKSSGAADGRRFADVLRTGVPKPPPAFPRSKKFLSKQPRCKIY